MVFLEIFHLILEDILLGNLSQWYSFAMVPPGHGIISSVGIFLAADLLVLFSIPNCLFP